MTWGTSTATGHPDVAGRQLVQRRILRVLITSQVLGGMGVSSGIAVGGLAARGMLNSDTYAGFASAGVTTGAALAAVPIARVMARGGRRPGLLAGYAVGVLGAGVALVAAVMGSFGLLVVGMLAFGAGNAANLQARYAAADLAEPAGRGRALATVVWATTIGAVLGPNLAGPTDRMGRALGLPTYGGVFALSALVFTGAGLVVAVLLRPDPLVLAGGTHRPGGEHRSVRQALAVIAAAPRARLGLAAMAVGQAVMVAVMTMTPLHLRHHDAGLTVVGLVISVHIAGMYALSPVVGVLADRVGRLPVLVIGAALLVLACVLAGTAATTATAQLTVGLFLLGLGWCCTLIGGSTLLVDAVPAPDRPAVQGSADLLMSACGGIGGVASGFVVGAVGFHGLNAVGGLIAAGLVVIAMALGRPRSQLSAG